MGCETTKILEDNSASNNQAEEPKFNDFEELGSK